MCNKPKIISLMGPTASGKTQQAIALFQKFSCDIISVDSAMVYREMNIGTAKPSSEELLKAPHRLIDICDPSSVYSVGQFCDDAKKEISVIHQAGRLPLLVGGTMLYFNSLEHGIADLPQANEVIRNQLTTEAKQLGWPAMHKKLEAVDPRTALQIHPNDAQRIQRALEVFLSSGQTLSALRDTEQSKPTDYNFVNIILSPDNRSDLHQRIKKRFDLMLKDGFLEEVEQLRARGDLNPDLPSMRTVGYRQAWAYLAGECDFETMKSKSIIATCQLAKRQFTWLRRWSNATRFNSESPDLKKQLFEFVSRLYDEH